MKVNLCSILDPYVKIFVISVQNLLKRMMKCKIFEVAEISIQKLVHYVQHVSKETKLVTSISNVQFLSLLMHILVMHWTLTLTWKILQF